MRNKDYNNIYLTGDTHGDFHELVTLTRSIGITNRDLLIILGDVGVNFTNEIRDVYSKSSLSLIPAAILCVHGNHERRPTSPDIRWQYEEKEWMGGTVWVEKEFPTILFAKDGCHYHVNERTLFVIGGAYSMDKPLRLRMDYPWFPDEQPSEEIREFCMSELEKHGWREDVVLSHTCPYDLRPLDKLMPGLDESKVDSSTELFLQKIRERITYNKWYCGHWHIDRKTPDIEFLYRKVTML